MQPNQKGARDTMVVATGGGFDLAVLVTLRKLPRQGDSGKGELLACDVGPVLRRFLTRTDSFFVHFDYLTLFGKLVRGQVPA